MVVLKFYRNGNTVIIFARGVESWPPVPISFVAVIGDAAMLLDDDYDARIEGWKAKVKSEIEPLIRPSLDRLQEITKYWAIKHWWTAEECAALFVGADPD